MKKPDLQGHGSPSRQDMVRAAIYMERRGFTWGEWAIVARLCDSSVAIRSYILGYVKDALDMWDGLKPHRGSFSYEIALIAAFHAYDSARKKCGPDARIRGLTEQPEPWTEDQYTAAWEKYCQAAPDRIRYARVTASLKETLEREACILYGEPYSVASGCTIIPFPVKEGAR